MAAISLKLPEDLLKVSGRYADALRLTRAEYIRRALEQMNRGTRARLRARRLAQGARGKPHSSSTSPNHCGFVFARPVR